MNILITARSRQPQCNCPCANDSHVILRSLFPLCSFGAVRTNQSKHRTDQTVKLKCVDALNCLFVHNSTLYRMQRHSFNRQRCSLYLPFFPTLSLSLSRAPAHILRIYCILNACIKCIFIRTFSVIQIHVRLKAPAVKNLYMQKHPESTIINYYYCVKH